MSRIFCPPGEQSAFLIIVCHKAGITLSTLARTLNLSWRTFRDWKRDKYHASKEIFEKLSSQYGIEMPSILEVRPEYWSADRYRGKAIINWKRKYAQLGTFEGSRKGGLVSQQRRRENPEYYRSLGMTVPNTFYIPNRDEVLAEFCGTVLGDGGLTARQCIITLNEKADAQFVYRVLEKLQFTPKIQDERNVWLYSQKEVFKYLQEIGSSNLRLFKHIEDSRVSHGKIFDGRGIYFLTKID